jgi:putative transcriptional regulator
VAISYKRLRDILYDNDIKMKVLEKDTGISHTTLSKINKDEYISLESLETIARYLKREIGDIISLKPPK